MWKKNLILFFLIFVTINLSASEIDSLEAVKIDSSKISLSYVGQLNTGRDIPNIFYSTVNKTLEEPLRIRVLLDNLRPVKNFPVIFRIISVPNKAKNTKLSADTVFTDVNGYASTFATLGDKEGDYEFSARIKLNTKKNDIIYFKAHARNSKWVMYLIFGLFGGLALFLFGMEMMSEGMKKTAGSKLRIILEKLTNNRVLAVVVGIFVTMIIQSSSATTVMLVSFAQAQLISFTQTLGVILGAGIGTTITAQMIAFKLSDYALIVIAFGFLILFFNKSKKIKHIGEIIFGFGVLFYGMHIMSQAMYPLRTYKPFIDLLLHLENPFYAIIIGTVFTALIQSSSAFSGILIVLGTQGLITLEAAIPLILGTNIGTSITAVLASLNMGREAKRVALAHTIFKIIGIFLFIFWIPTFAELVRAISPEASQSVNKMAALAEIVPRQIANAHTIFNVALTLILLPFTNLFSKLIVYILPDKQEDEDENSIFKTKYLESSLISTPTLALNLAKAETIRMMNKVKNMVGLIIIPFLENNEKPIQKILDTEDEVDFLSEKINEYLTKIIQKDFEAERADEVFQIMHCVTEVEQIGDIVTKRLIFLVKNKIEFNLSFSEQGLTEIKDYHSKTMKQINRAIEVFKDVNLQDAKKMEKKYKKYRLMEMDLRKTHFGRLQKNVTESIETSKIHIELIELLKRISSSSTNIARIFLETKKG
ncbi:MAG: Na/Pi cotransporter II-like protein [Ignavibacteriae bacterium]|nr:MAG: Na/Pi cotransporter II-like protein [Ignavibacteriota bacterium]